MALVALETAPVTAFIVEFAAVEATLEREFVTSPIVALVALAISPIEALVAFATSPIEAFVAFVSPLWR